MRLISLVGVACIMVSNTVFAEADMVRHLYRQSQPIENSMRQSIEPNSPDGMRMRELTTSGRERFDAQKKFRDFEEDNIPYIDRD